MNPYVFIVGCSRSGTTLLRRMVDAHPEIAITPETHWITQFSKRRTGLSDDGHVTSATVTALRGQSKFPKLGVEPAQLERLLSTDGPLSFARFVTAVFDLYGRQRGKALVGDKTPGYVRDIHTLHALWPRARFVHIIRDGRDVCLSALNWKRKADDFRRRFPTWDEDPVTTAALWWRWHVELGRRVGMRLPPGLYREVRYETLVQEPEDTCRTLCAFLDLPYEDAMVRFHEGRTRRKPGLDAKHAWLPPTPGLRDWESQMPADVLERVEAAAGDLLDELGYARGAGPPDAEREEETARIAARFVAAAPKPWMPLPDGW